MQIAVKQTPEVDIFYHWLFWRIIVSDPLLTSAGGFNLLCKQAKGEINVALKIYFQRKSSVEVAGGVVYDILRVV